MRDWLYHFSLQLRVCTSQCVVSARRAPAAPHSLTIPPSRDTPYPTSSLSAVYLNDLYAFNLAALRWTRLNSENDAQGPVASLCRNTHVPPGLARPQPHPGQACHSGLALPPRSGPAVRHPLPNFSMAQYRFFSEIYLSFSLCPRMRDEGRILKFSTKGENSLTALKQPCPPRRADLSVMPRHLVGLRPSACTQCCTSDGNCLKSHADPHCYSNCWVLRLLSHNVFPVVLHQCSPVAA